MIKKILIFIKKLFEIKNTNFLEFFLLLIFALLLFFEKLTLFNIIKFLIVILLIRLYVSLLYFFKNNLNCILNYFSKKWLLNLIVLFDYWSYFSNILILILWNLNINFYFFWRWLSIKNISFIWKNRIYFFFLDILFKPLLRLLYMYYSLILRWEKKTFIELMFSRLEGLVISIIFILGLFGNYYLENIFIFFCFSYTFLLVFYPSAIEKFIKKENFNNINFNVILYLRNQTVISKIIIEQLKLAILKNNIDINIYDYQSFGKFFYLNDIINIFNKDIMFMEVKNKPSIFWYNYVANGFNEIHSFCELFIKFKYLINLCKKNKLLTIAIINNNELSHIEYDFKNKIYILKKLFFFIKDIKLFFNLKWENLILQQDNFEGFFFTNLKFEQDKILDMRNNELILNSLKVSKNNIKFNDVLVVYKFSLVLNKLISNYKDSNEYLGLKYKVDFLEKFLIEQKLCFDLAYDHKYIKFLNKYFLRLIILWKKYET